MWTWLYPLIKYVLAYSFNIKLFNCENTYYDIDGIEVKYILH